MELKSKIGADIITLRFQADDPTACEKALDALSGLQGVKEIGSCTVGLAEDSGLTVMSQNGAAMVPQVVRALDGAGVEVQQLTLSAPTLDEVFLKLTGKTLNVVERKPAVKGGGFGKRRQEP
jgi:ABC-2 type transport system ATP-binding protein